MIEVKDLTFSYGKDKQALHGLNFTVGDGEIFGFLGPNGSGKSTTQKILTGILKGHGGKVSLFGQDISSAHTQEFFQKIGVLFEFPYLYANLSVLDNLRYFASFYPREQLRDAYELLDDLEFKRDFLKKPVSSYSKGMRQRASMARALISNPKLLFLDEPTSGLAGTQTGVSPLVYPVSSLEELDAALARDINGVGVGVSDGKPSVVLYTAAEKADRHRADYALALLRSGGEYTPETVGRNTPEMKQRKDITCELLFIEIVAVGFLGIASVLFKEKQMGVVRVHVIMPLIKNLFVFSKVFLFLLTDLAFAVLMILFNVGLAEAGGILPGVLLQTTILSLIMALVGFGCTMLLKDFKQFSLAYLVIALFAVTPVFLAANTSVKMAWINYHPFYHVYMGLRNAFFGIPVTNPAYYICAACAIILLFGVTLAAFRKEMGKEG